MTDEQKRGVDAANEIVAKLLDHLGKMGFIASEELSAEQKDLYIKNACSFVAFAVATMPCVQTAMGLARPELSPEDRYWTVILQIARCFGFDPEKEDSPRYFRPKNPLLN